MGDILQSLAAENQRPWLNRIERLALNPPQTILFEGGDENLRSSYALYWAMAANCPQAIELALQGKPAKPCLSCPVCQRIAANEDKDIFILDGRISNTADKENPGPIRALNVDNARELKSRIATKPHGNGKRVVIFQGMLLNSRDTAMNALLKNLEDPCGHTLFALLAPQRAQILPTLVSRAIVITLPWPDSFSNLAEIEEWKTSFIEYLATGRDFLDKISGKKSIDPIRAGQIILFCQQTLARVIEGKHSPEKNSLENLLMPLREKWPALTLLIRWMNEAQEMLLGGVNPARALEAFASRLYALDRENEKG